MPQSRYFVDSTFEKEKRVFLSYEETRHLRVLRKQEGERVELVNGQNQLAQGQIISFGKKEACVEILEFEESLPATVPVILCQAIPRMPRLDLIVEKGTELGMHELWLFVGEKSEKKSPSLPRLRAISISAMKQCGRLDLPKILLKPPLSSWKEEELPYTGFYGDLSPNAPSLLNAKKNDPGTLLFIGPEGGFSSTEKKILESLHIQGVKLHPHVLRTDTAPIVGLSILNA
ncbi:MAG: Ribosomal RNA small subunit methyltransferase E [Chlamydiae bacterium]|nr:Ribosomal RNA small subunit methyltransferase E [Chlamydiota bacterium]